MLETDLQRTHIGTPDFGPAFSKAVLYVFSFATLMISEPPDQIVQ